MKNSKSIFWVVIKSAFTFLLVAVIAAEVYLTLQQWTDVKDKSKLVQLNNLRPRNYNNLINPSSSIVEDQEKIERYFRYYVKLAEYMPHRPEAHGLLGYCYYRLGRYDEAVASYKKAAQLNPSFFWYHYNLGVIHYSQGRYKLAQESLGRALQTDIKLAVLFIQSSQRIYLPIVQEKIVSQSDLQNEFFEGVTNAKKLGLLSQLMIKNQKLIKKPLPTDPEVRLRVY